MTFTTFNRPGDRALRLQLSAQVFHLMQRFDDYRNYRRTVAELQTLGHDQLADLGLHASEIKRAARDAVYGPQR